jgi:hypothetical protein
METLTTEVIEGQEYYALPLPQKMSLTVYNKKKKEFRKQDFVVYIKPNKLLKTDETLRIEFKKQHGNNLDNEDINGDFEIIGNIYENPELLNTNEK